MVRQKLTKSNSKSVSLASTKSASSSEKRTSLAAATASTTGLLPFKKRHKVSSSTVHFPSDVEMKTKDTRKKASKTVHSSVSIEEYDGSYDASKESESAPMATSPTHHTLLN
jgi:hypothetical protein